MQQSRKFPEKPPSGSKAFLIGAAVSLTFYAFVHQPLMRGSMLYIYTTQHITEYAVVILFFWACADLFLSFIGLGRESRAANYKWLPLRDGLQSVDEAAVLMSHVDIGPTAFQTTKMGRRLRAALGFVHERRSAEGFREYLDELAGRDGDAILARYSFPRFASSLLPILGLIGTVVHFGTALSGLTEDQMANKIPEIVSGIGTAFNTTFAAMSACAVTLLLRFLVERRDEQIVLQINRYVEDELLNRFAKVDAQLTPFLDAVHTAQIATLATVGDFEKKLAEQWEQRLSQSQERWEAIDRQRESQFEQLLSRFDRQQLAHAAKLNSAMDQLAVANKMTQNVANLFNSDGQLLHLQQRLVDNLTLLRETQQLDEAMHGLTAAIHLLTARQSAPGSIKRAA